MSLGSHQATIGKSQIHLTPRWITDLLGPFDMDPCAAAPRPWDIGNINYTQAEDGLSKEWVGRIWLNPPFDRYQVERWVQKLANHGHGTALLHARTEAEWFRPIWQKASLILFMGKRIKFCLPDGTQHADNSGAPPVLIAFGVADALRLNASGIEGARVYGWRAAA